MSIEKVREYFRGSGMEDRIREFPVSSATVELAARAVGVEPGRIAKSMSFRLGEDAIVIVMAGDARVDNARYKARCHAKAKMLTPEETSELIGHAPGGVCPFAVNDGVKICLDVSLKRFDEVFPACGSGNSAIGLTIPELEKYSGYPEWVDVCKLSEQQ